MFEKYRFKVWPFLIITFAFVMKLFLTVDLKKVTFLINAFRSAVVFIFNDGSTVVVFGSAKIGFLDVDVMGVDVVVEVFVFDNVFVSVFVEVLWLVVVFVPTPVMFEDELVFVFELIFVDVPVFVVLVVVPASVGG